MKKSRPIFCTIKHEKYRLMYVTTQAWSLESGWGGVQGTAWAASVQPHHVSSLHKRASRVAPLADGHGTQPAHPTLLFRVLRRQQPAHHAWLPAAADASPPSWQSKQVFSRRPAEHHGLGSVSQTRPRGRETPSVRRSGTHNIDPADGRCPRVDGISNTVHPWGPTKRPRASTPRLAGAAQHSAGLLSFYP